MFSDMPGCNLINERDYTGMPAKKVRAHYCKIAVGEHKGE